jgi:hypothetical protein
MCQIFFTNYNGMLHMSKVEQIRNEIKWAFDMYKKFAWGYDDLNPRLKRGHNWIFLGNTIVDSLDTLYLANLHDDFRESVQWVHHNLTLKNVQVNAFEVTIRILGGLLSAYALSKQPILLTKAEMIGKHLSVPFRRHMYPPNIVNLQTGYVQPQRLYSLAQVGTLQLEHRYLSYITSKPELKKNAFYVCSIMKRLAKQSQRTKKCPGLLSQSIYENGRSQMSTYSIGAEADSYYEYMLKIYLQDGSKDKIALKNYAQASESIRHNLFRWRNDKLAYVTSGHCHKVTRRQNIIVSKSMGHLECFAPAMFAIEAYKTNTTSRNVILRDAEALMQGCLQLYDLSNTVGAESVRMNRLDTKIQNSANMLRPEVVESLYILWKVTKKEMYRNYSWNIFTSFRKHSKFANGYCSMSNVRRPSCDSTMESFFIAETLKYIYLMFDDKIDLDKWVFNTEAHPLPIIKDMPSCYGASIMDHSS